MPGQDLHGHVLDHAGIGKRGGVIQRADPIQDTGNPQQEAEVTDPVDQECFQVGNTAVGFLYQKPISRYDTRPTASQPKNSCMKLLLITSINMLKVNSEI